MRFLAGEAGIRQIIDVGTGIPAAGNVHEVAAQVAPGTRVAYVDNDPIVHVHANALLTGSGTTSIVLADLRQPEAIPAHPKVRALIDFSQPVALLLVAILHFITEQEDLDRILTAFRAGLPAGSYLALSHATGTSARSPAGCAGNLRRLGQDPADIEAIVCSHGHFDHTTGLSGLIGQLGRANLPVLIHPEFWARRRLAIPGGEPFELPTTSRRALENAGFDVIEQRQPSFLYDRSVLITGEVDRVTGFEKGFRSTRPGAAKAGSPTR